MTRAHGLLCLALLLCAGCQSVHPLGDDFGELDRAGQLTRASETLREVFATELGPVGEPRPDREVLELDPQRIVYRAEEQRVRLDWDQVQDVDVEAFPREPGGPETVRLLLDPESAPVADAVRPLLARAGLKRAYVELARRPPRSGERVRAALACFRREREPEPEAGGEDPPATTVDPVSETATAPANADSEIDDPASADSTAADPASADPVSPGVPSAGEPDPEPQAQPTPDDVEAQLRRLKQWHAEGLISDEDYARERRALLEGLR